MAVKVQMVGQAAAVMHMTYLVEVVVVIDPVVLVLLVRVMAVAPVRGTTAQPVAVVVLVEWVPTVQVIAVAPVVLVSKAISLAMLCGTQVGAAVSQTCLEVLQHLMEVLVAKVAVEKVAT